MSGATSAVTLDVGTRITWTPPESFAESNNLPSRVRLEKRDLPGWGLRWTVIPKRGDHHACRQRLEDGVIDLGVWKVDR